MAVRHCMRNTCCRRIHFNGKQVEKARKRDRVLNNRQGTFAKKKHGFKFFIVMHVPKTKHICIPQSIADASLIKEQLTLKSL